MKLTVLGCWAPYPAPGGACSGYLLQAGDKNILIDCGNGVISNLQKHLNFRKLDLVLISHLHPDHHHDLYCLRHAIAGARRTENVKTVPLYLPGNPVQDYEKIRSFDDAFVVKSVETVPSIAVNGVQVRTIDFNGMKITFVPVAHSLPGYALVIEDQTRLFYSGDTKWTEYLPEFASGADLMLCEASLTEKDKKYTSVGHLTAKEAGELARRADAKKLMLTHFWPEYEMDTLKNEAESSYGSSVIMASEGLQAVF